MTLQKPALYFVFPGDLNTRTGGYIYDRRLIDDLTRLGHRVQTVRLVASFPFPSEKDLAEADDALAGLTDGATVIIDGLAFGAMPKVAASHAGRLALIALVHHPLCDETDLDASTADRLFHSEREALGTAHHVICTSTSTARRLKDFGIKDSRISVIEPGVDHVPASPCSRSNGATRLLTVGTLTRRKGHEVLVEALARITDLPWTLTIAGSDKRDPTVAASVRRAIAKAGLADRITLAGEIDSDRLEDLWRTADLFVFASYHEGYGMVITEAVARGLPIVTTRAGAVAETAPKSAAVLVPTGDAVALASALHDLMTDSDQFARLRQGALAARSALRDWSAAAAQADALIDRVRSAREQQVIDL